ncbi:MAG: AraC family transcriptional regulator [Lachnospiraceae bacterium]|nr:AraC family transcriptional regulator [Lachnospiraceae bacterium]
MNTKQEHATINNERGIISKKGGRFHTSSPFAQENLYTILWGDEYVCNDTYSVKRESLNAISLYHIVSGKMEFRYNGQHFFANEGDTVLLDLKKPHEYRSVSKLRLQQYLIEGAPAQRYCDYLTEQFGYLYSPSAKLALLFGKIQQEVEAEFMNEHRVSYLLHEIFSRLVMQETSQISPSVEKARQYMNRHYQEPISVDDVAEHVLLSRSHLNRLFRKELGCGPHEYLLQTRLNISKELLTESRLSVESIALQTGFQSSTHYIRAFKKATNMTPSYFRRFFNPLAGTAESSELIEN